MCLYSDPPTHMAHTSIYLIFLMSSILLYPHSVSALKLLLNLLSNSMNIFTFIAHLISLLNDIISFLLNYTVSYFLRLASDYLIYILNNLRILLYIINYLGIFMSYFYIIIHIILLLSIIYYLIS